MIYLSIVQHVLNMTCFSVLVSVTGIPYIPDDYIASRHLFFC